MKPTISATLLLLFAASSALALDPHVGARTRRVEGAKGKVEKTDDVQSLKRVELAEFDPEDSGKAVWYVLRWVSTTGQPGPWGPVFAAVVP